MTLLSLEELRGCAQGANYSGSHRDSSHSPLPLLAEPASAAAPGPELTLIRLLEQHSRYRGVRNTASPTPAPSALHSSALPPTVPSLAATTLTRSPPHPKQPVTASPGKHNQKITTRQRQGHWDAAAAWEQMPGNSWAGGWGLFLICEVNLPSAWFSLSFFFFLAGDVSRVGERHRTSPSTELLQTAVLPIPTSPADSSCLHATPWADTTAPSALLHHTTECLARGNPRDAALYPTEPRLHDPWKVYLLANLKIPQIRLWACKFPATEAAPGAKSNVHGLSCQPALQGCVRAAPQDGHGLGHPQPKSLFYGLVFLPFIPVTIKSGQLLLTINQLQMRSSGLPLGTKGIPSQPTVPLAAACHVGAGPARPGMAWQGPGPLMDCRPPPRLLLQKNSAPLL